VESESAEQLARRWIAEERAAWRPQFGKIGVNRGPLGAVDRKLARAAARRLGSALQRWAVPFAERMSEAVGRSQSRASGGRKSGPEGVPG